MPEVLKFLDPYTRKDIDFYFGRHVETELLYDKVKSNRITLFYGLSGTGKTSLILCGLANLFDEIDWMPFVIRRGSNTDILTATKNTIQKKGRDVNTVVPTLSETVDTVTKLLDRVYNIHFLPIYLIFDQLEELFIYGNKEEKGNFIKFLVKVKDDMDFVKVILVIREEFFVHLDDFETKIPEIFKSRVRLQPMKVELEENKINEKEKDKGIVNDSGKAVMPDKSGEVIDIPEPIKDKSGLHNLETRAGTDIYKEFETAENEMDEEVSVKDVIMGIGRALRFDLSKEVVNEIINHIRVKPKGYHESDFERIEKKIELPYLQIYFSEIVKNMSDRLGHLPDGEFLELTTTDLPTLGSINDVLTDFLDKCVKEINEKLAASDNPDNTERNIWRVLNVLVSYKGTKQSKTINDIKNEIDSGNKVNTLLN